MKSVGRRDRLRGAFTALSVSGNLFPAEFLQTIAAQKAKHQAASDYGLTKSLVLKDELARYWRIANDLYSTDSLVPLLRDAFGYKDLAPAEPEQIADRTFPITHGALGGAARFVLAPHDVSLDRADPRFGDGGRGRAPQNLLQEALNADPARPWGIVSNGTTLRLVRENPSLTRPAYVQADLQRIFDEQLYADFAALWLTIHASRLAPIAGKPGNCILEAWRAEAQETGERALEHLRDGVTTALQALGNGFLANPLNEPLRAQLRDGSLSSDAYFQELLRLVYRLLFLFTVEDRGLLYDPAATNEERAMYRDGYALARLRERALRRRHYDRHADLWVGLQIVFRSLNAGVPAFGLPALGGLFAADQCLALDGSVIANEALLQAIRALTYFRSGAALVRVNYRDMGTEEFGSVYESLLELHPYLEVNSAPWTFGFVGENGESSKGSARRLSGSYYTPASLVNELTKSALEPVIARAVENYRADPRRALLDLRIVDPACGSGHFLLAAARRIAVEIARIEAGADTPDELVRQHALREVVQRCIYGVDRNPLAVELCRTALWIEAVEPGKPLTFLDPHICLGDSLIGVLDPSLMADGIPGEAYEHLAGDDKAVCRTLKERNHQSGSVVQGNLFDQESLKEVGAAEVTLEAMPEETVAEIDAKREAWQRMREDARLQRETLRANLFVGAFLGLKTAATADYVPITEDLNRLQRGMSMRTEVAEFANDLSRRHRFFHWHITFAEIIRRGGFDTVIGNPPWKRLKVNEREFFATRAPSIAALQGKKRKSAISALVQDSPSLWTSFSEELATAEHTGGFIRTSRSYPLTGKGDLNTSPLFAERGVSLLATHARFGMVLRTGIATEESRSSFFERIFRTRELVSLYDFTNSEEIFPDVAQVERFCLLTIAGSDVAADADFVFLADSVNDLTDGRRHFHLNIDDLRRINPNTLTCPMFRTVVDANIAKSIYERVPVLASDARDRAPDVQLREGLFHMTASSALFMTYDDLASSGAQLRGNIFESADSLWLPLYEAKMIDAFDHRYGSYPVGHIEDTRALPHPDVPAYQDSYREPLPRYWVPSLECTKRLDALGWRHDWLMGFRRVTRANFGRATTACVMPRVGVGNTIILLLPSGKGVPLCAALVANFCSLVFDYLARQKIGSTDLNIFTAKQLPMIPFDRYSDADLDFVCRRVLELSFTSEALSPFARDLEWGGGPFLWDPERRAVLQSELDAYYARLYGLTRDELRFMLDPADVHGPDYPSETFRVLKEREIREYGEYRTGRLVLQAWDQLGETNRH